MASSRSFHWANVSAEVTPWVEVTMFVPLLAASAAGALTTVAGAGGGTMLVLFLMAWGATPMEALAATTVGLLAGNIHRAWLYRRKISRGHAWALTRGALPAAAIAGWFTVELPDEVLRVGIGAIALTSVVMIANGWRIRPPKAGWTLAGAMVGTVSATTGGGGLLAGPFLLANGLTGQQYIATGAALATSVHIGRVVGYSTGGAMGLDVLVMGLGFAAAIPLGNLAGHQIRTRIPKRSSRPIELGVAGVVATLALVGLT